MLLAHDIAGAGSPVVLLHSAVCDRRMWDPQWGELVAAGYRVLRPDFRGFGETPVPTDAYNNADDVINLMDSYGLERTAVVGSSFGGRVAQEIAARYPDRVTRLVLLCTSTRDHPRTAEFAAFAEREDALIEAGKLDEVVQLNVETFVGPRAGQATRDLVAAMQRHAFEVQLAGPDVPEVSYDVDLADVKAATVVVTGGHDLSYFAEIGAAMVSCIPEARPLRLDWAGHLPSLEDPELFNPVFMELIRG